MKKAVATVLLHFAAVAALFARPVVTGTVLDSAGRPFPAAQVELVPIETSFEAGRLRLAGRDLSPPQAAVQSDARGRFMLEAPQAGVFKVVARAAGTVPMQYGPALLLESEELPPAQLPGDVRLRVRIADEQGRPVAGAWVLAAPAAGPAARGWRPEFRVGRTAADGSLTLPRTEGERLQVSLGASGRTEQIEPGVPEAAIQLRPRHETTVSLRVVTPDSAPVEGVLVRVGEQAWPAGATGSDGTVAVPVVPGETVRARLLAADGRQQVLNLRPEEGSNGGTRTVILAPAVRVAGRVLDAASGRGLPDAVLWLEADPAITLRTDREGRYVLTASSKGRLALEARAAGFLPKRVTVSPAEIAAGRAPAVALDRAATIRGSVVGPDGKPLAGASVVAVSATNLGIRTFSPLDPATDRAATGPDGGFALRQLRTETEYELRVTKPGYFPAARTAVAATAVADAKGAAPALQVQLRTACGVHGAVRDAQGQPVTAARVVLRPVRRPGREGVTGDEPAPEGPDPAATMVESGEAGRFAVLESPAAEVDLDVRKAGYAPALRRGIRLGASCGGSVDLGPVVLQPGVRLVGRVVDHRGKAIADAEVFLIQRLLSRASWEPALERRKPDAATRRDGTFTVDDLARDVPQYLLVRADGYLATAVGGVRPPLRGPLLVRMEPAAVLRGRLLDEAGEAVSGARAVLTWQAVLPDDPRERPVGEIIERTAASNVEGIFEITGAPTGAATLDVTAPGFISIEGYEVSLPTDPARELTLRLRRGARLEGRVTTTAAEPVAGARIAVGGSAALSDAEGVYAVDGIAPGPQEVDVFHPHYRRRVRPLQIEEGTNRFDVELEAGVEVAGRVVDPDGRPVAAALVELTTASRADLRTYRSRTGTDGSFRLAPVAAGRYGLEASASGFATAKRPRPIVVADQPVDGLEIVLRRGATVSGRVLGLSAEELPAVKVMARGEAGEERVAAMDSEGRYEVRDLPPGDWLLRASLWQAQRQVEARVPIGPTDRELVRDLEFSARITLSGRVLFEDEPLAGSAVAVRGERFSIERSVTTDFDGGFLLQDLEPDRYWLGVSDRERALVHNDSLDLKADREITIRLQAAAIAGRVEDAGTGHPIPEAVLSLRPTAGSDFLISDSSFADGSFRIIHIPPGSYRLSARADGYAPAEREIRLAAGEELAGLELDLTPTAGLKIRVRLASGGVPPLVHVQARNAEGATILAGSYSPDSSGVTNLASLPAGTWSLLIGAPGGAMAQQPVTVPGEPLAITLAGAGRLQVRIPELASENLLGTLRLLGQDQKPFQILGLGGTIEESWTLTGGKATVEGVPAGQWLVVAEAPNGRVWQGAVATSGAGEVAVSLE